MADAQTSHLHMNGPMIAGGSGYTLGELAALPEHPVHSSGLPLIDELCDRGIHSGEVWTIAAQSRMGATVLATQMAVAASRTAEVLFVNGHVGTRMMRDRVGRAAERSEAKATAWERLRLASWEPQPTWTPDQPFLHLRCRAGQAPHHHVDVFDTLDEAWSPHPWPTTAEERLQSLRSHREDSRWKDRAVVLTARVEPGPNFDSAWQRHWACAAFADVGDVQLEISIDGIERQLLLYRRGGHSRRFTLNLDIIGGLFWASKPAGQ